MHRAYGMPLATAVLGARAGRDREDFRGVQLTQLGVPRGRHVGMRYWPGGAAGLLEDTSFWTRYVVDGRCALDPLHQDDSNGDRFCIDGEQRHCLWCGQTQRLFHFGGRARHTHQASQLWTTQ